MGIIMRVLKRLFAVAAVIALLLVGVYFIFHIDNVTVEGTEMVGGISGDNEGGGRYKDCSFHGSVIGSANTGGICAFYNGA